MAVNVKLGVEYSAFKRGMSEAQESVKTLTEKLKANESQLQKTGDKEEYLKNKVELLKQQIANQKAVVENANKALEQMASGGVDKASRQYQQMERNVYKAVDQLNKMETELGNVENGADRADTETGELNNQLKNIGKGVSWQNVTEGLDNVINKLESGARAAINFGKRVLNSAKGSTGWADDLLTLSAQTGIDTTTLQQMEKVAEFVDTSVDTVIAAKNRMQRAATTSGGKASIEEVLGLSLNGQTADDLFWEVGEALVSMDESFDKTAAAQQIFGRSWQELLPLFKTGRTEYERMLSEQSTLTEDQVQKLGQADDAIKSVEQQVQELKNTFWAENADKITGLMQWIVDNKDSVVAALTAIAGGFSAMKMAAFAANLMKTIDGFKSLGLLGGAGNGSSLAQATGTGTGGTGAAVGGAAAKTVWSKLWGFAGSAAVPAGVITTALLPALLAQNANYAAEKETLNRRLSVSGGSDSLEAQWLAQAAQALNIDWGKNADFSTIENMLMGMNDRSDLQKMQLRNMLGDSYTDQGNNTWNELQRLWGGEEMDAGRLVSIMESVADSYEKMVSTQENAVTSDDIQGLNDLPGLVESAVEKGAASGVSGIKVEIDGYSAGKILAPYISAELANSIYN